MPIIEEIQKAGNENQDHELLRSALAISEYILSRRYVVLNKTNLLQEDVVQSAFDCMQATSNLEGFLDRKGSPVIYSSFSIGTSELLSAMINPQTVPWINTFISEIGKLSEYTSQARERLLQGIPYTDRLGEKNWSNEDIITGLCRSILEEKYTRLSIKLRSVLTYFGNPHWYPIDDIGARFYDEANPNYPMMVPLFNIHFDHPPAGDPLAFYNDFNRRYYSQEAALNTGKKKLADIFSPEELVTAEESWALVEFVDGWLYQSFGLPHTTMAIASSLFPYDAIAQRYGDSYEGWLRFGPNDELIDAIKRVAPEKI